MKHHQTMSMMHSRHHQTLWVSALIGLLAIASRLDTPVSIGHFVCGTTGLAIAAAVAGCLLAETRICALQWSAALALVLILTFITIQPSLSIATAALYSGGMVMIFLCAQRSARIQLPSASVAPCFGDSLSVDAYQQRELHREIDRARRFDRPLSLAILVPRKLSQGRGATPHNGQGSLNETEIVRLCKLLTERIKACDILMFRDGQLLLVLPDTELTLARSVTTELTNAARAHLDVQLQIGIAGFPSEEVTLAGLWDLATCRLNQAPSQTVLDAQTTVNGSSIHLSAMPSQKSREGVLD